MNDKIDHYISSGLVIQPGDHVLLSVKHDLDMQTVDQMRSELATRFPDVEFTFIAGVTGMGVQRA